MDVAAFSRHTGPVLNQIASLHRNIVDRALLESLPMVVSAEEFKSIGKLLLLRHLIQTHATGLVHVAFYTVCMHGFSSELVDFFDDLEEN